MTVWTHAVAITVAEYLGENSGLSALYYVSHTIMDSFEGIYPCPIDYFCRNIRQLGFNHRQLRIVNVDYDPEELLDQVYRLEDAMVERFGSFETVFFHLSYILRGSCKPDVWRLVAHRSSECARYAWLVKDEFLYALAVQARSGLIRLRHLDHYIPILTDDFFGMLEFAAGRLILGPQEWDHLICRALSARQMRCAHFCVVNSRRDLYLVPGILAALVKADAIDAFIELTESRSSEFCSSDIVDALVLACTLSSLPNRYRFLDRIASIKSGDLNIRYGMRENCLHLLAQSGAEIRCFDLVEELGVDRSSHTTYGESVMDLAAKGGHFELCMELARRGFHMTCIGYLLSPEDPRWHERRVSITLLRHVVPRISEINSGGRLRGSDLEFNPVEPFVYYGDTDVLNFLISCGLDVEICRTSHRYGAPLSHLPLFNCLHLAILATRDKTVSKFGMHERVVSFLVGTYPLLLEVPTGFGCFPHALAENNKLLQCMWPSLEIASRSLQDILTPPRGFNEYTSDALVKLAMALEPTLVDAIFMGDAIRGLSGADLNGVYENNTALTMCAERGRLTSCMCLIGQGAIVESDAVPSALVSAAKSGNTRLAALLIEQGARINRVDLHRLGNGPATALQSAHSVRSRVMEDFLLSNGAVWIGDSREIKPGKRKLSDFISGAFTHASRVFKRLFH